MVGIRDWAMGDLLVRPVGESSVFRDRPQRVQRQTDVEARIAMRCKLCGQFTDAVIIWLSEPRDDGTHAIRVPLCLKCSEQVSEQQKRDRLYGIQEAAIDVDIRTPYMGINRSNYPKKTKHL